MPILCQRHTNGRGLVLCRPRVDTDEAQFSSLSVVLSLRDVYGEWSHAKGI
jgi:hypothetical protein